MAGRAGRAGWAVIAGLLAATIAGCSFGPPPWGGGGEGGPVVVSTDGRVLATAGNYSSCGTESTLVASESPTEVALSVRLTVVSTVEVYCERGSPPLTVRLAAPLGSRKLVDAATGQPLPQFSARLLLQPTVLPPGYRPWQVEPVLAGPVAGGKVWYSRLTGADQPGDGQFYITEYPDRPFVPGPWQSPRPTGEEGPWTRISVRGVQGWAEKGIIAWRQGGLDYSMGQLLKDGRLSFTVAQLVAIADSAKRWTGPIPAVTGPAQASRTITPSPA
jgi:hypothetical protein